MLQNLGAVIYVMLFVFQYMASPHGGYAQLAAAYPQAQHTQIMQSAMAVEVTTFPFHLHLSRNLSSMFLTALHVENTLRMSLIFMNAQKW